MFSVINKFVLSESRFKSCCQCLDQLIAYFSKHTYIYIGHVFEREMEELREKYEQQIELLRQQLSQLQEQLEEEKELLTQRYESERETIEDQLAQQIRDELEVRRKSLVLLWQHLFG